MSTRDILIQTNSIRGEMLESIADKTVEEILANVAPMLGPGACDAFISKEGAPYYTRDGKEVMESLRFDNELANIIHHIFFQASYHQGKEVGDGSTTLAVLYCRLYQLIRQSLKSDKGNNAHLEGSVNKLRKMWTEMTTSIVDELKKASIPMTEDRLLSMLYTCTQDADLTQKIYTNLKDAILAGAYIVPRKSNIASDFNVTTYNRPTFKVTRQFSLKPMQTDIDRAVVLYCAGMLDIPYSEILAGMIGGSGLRVGRSGEVIHPTIILLCHGVTENTRRSIREVVQLVKANGWDINSVNNVAIYTLNDYRKFTQEESEDIGTILTGEKGLGSIVQPITYANLLYHVFCKGTTMFTDPNNPDQKLEWMDKMESFDVDPHTVDAMKSLYYSPYHVMLDEIEGIALDCCLNRAAQERYDKLMDEINSEKSPIRKADLNKRLRRMYGMFIDIEVGSTLLKDSQRKFELILDAILSASEGAKDGVLEGNSVIHAYKIVRERFNNNPCGIIMADALAYVLNSLLYNYNGETMEFLMDSINTCVDNPDTWKIADFNLTREKPWWPEIEDAKQNMVHVTTSDGDILEINTTVVEPVGIMASIIENSTLPLEVATTKIIHISGNQGYMNNFIE